MRRFQIVAKNPDHVPGIRRKAEARGLICDSKSPDVVFSVGGDGTFLRSERCYPGVPKILVKESLICFKCHGETLDEALDLLQSEHCRVFEHHKLEARTQGVSLQAVNDVVIRNDDPRRALRFRLTIDGQPVDDLLIGDGIVVATPFGSTGYYRSITRTPIEKGIGLAFNNLTEPRDPQVLDEDGVIELAVERSRGLLSADNHPALITLGHGHRVVVRRAEAPPVRIVGHD